MDIERVRQILKELNPIFWNDKIDRRLKKKNPPMALSSPLSPEDFVDECMLKGNFPNETPIKSALGRYLLALSDGTSEEIRTKTENLCRELEECLTPYDKVFEVLQREFQSSFAQQVLLTHKDNIRNLSGLPVRTVKDWLACIVCMSHKDFWADLTSTKQNAKQAKSPKAEEKLDYTHSEDYTSVVWCGKSYQFTKTQALCIKYLWAEWEKSEGLGLSEKTIGDKIGSSADNYKLKHTFRVKRNNKSLQHPAWGKMIVPCGKGTFCLKSSRKK
jgi:hypothetical protein